MKKFLIFISILFVSFFINGCGDDKVDENEFPTKPASYEMARLAESDNELVSLDIYKVLIDVDNFGNINNLYQRKISSKINSSQKISLRLLSEKLTTYDCEDGYANLDKISENEAYVTYHHCLVNDTILDGKAHIFKYSSNSAKIDFDYLTILGDNSEKLIIKKATFEVNDNIFKIKKMYANYRTLKDNVEFLNYNQIVINDVDNAIVVVTINGYIKTNCLNGYVYVKTLPELNIQNDLSYLTGALEISSNSSKITIDFEEDGVYITDVDGIEEFLTYDDIKSKTKDLSCN